jgi:uncharacterized protein YndB with AHSA1/START domain
VSSDRAAIGPLDRRHADEPPALAREASTAIGLTRRFAAPASLVFQALIDPSIASQWLFATARQSAIDVAIDAWIGGTFAFVEERRGAHVVHRGHYLEMHRPRRLAFTLCCDDLGPVQTHVEIDVEPDAGGCTVELVHDRIPRSRAGYARDRWLGMFYGLGELLGAREHAGDRRPHASTGERHEPTKELR